MTETTDPPIAYLGGLPQASQMPQHGREWGGGGPERYVAVDNVCAWPNVKADKDGVVYAALFNQPTHGGWEGGVDCYASTDGGRFWSRRSAIAPQEPTTARVNHAMGFAANGDLLAIVGGFGDKTKPPIWGRANRRAALPAWVCRSGDGGRTWERSELTGAPPELRFVVPYGDIVRLDNDTLATNVYGEVHREGGPRWSFIIFSEDDGRTWGDPRPIAVDDYNETAIVSLGRGRLLAAARTHRPRDLHLFVSGDHGQTWTNQGPLSLPKQVPAGWLVLADGRVMLVYSVRNPPGFFGLMYRLSDDRGQSFGPPISLLNMPGAADGGYPSSAQLPDGTIVTAYYSGGVQAHQRYHMGVLRWRLD